MCIAAAVLHCACAPSASEHVILPIEPGDNDPRVNEHARPGDALHFNCHLEYTAERASEVDAPLLPEEQGRLPFANQIYGGEMCVLFGTVTGAPFETFPILDLSQPPAFATVN